MFAYFRNRDHHPHPHRRAGSNPTTPTSPRLQSPSHPSQWPDMPQASSNSPASARPVSSCDSPISTFPPVLPPIPRVASTSGRHRHVEDSVINGERSYGQGRAAVPMAATVVDDDTARAHTAHIQHTSEDAISGPIPVPPAQSSHPQDARPDLPWSPSFKSLYLEPLDVRTAGGSRQQSQPVPQPSQASPSTPSHQLEPIPSSRRASSFFPGKHSAPSNLAQESPNTSVYPFSSTHTLLPKSASSGNLSAAENIVPLKQTQTASERTQQVPTRQHKSKLNLLNPVSLLLRRRSSQITEDPADAPLPVPRGMDFHVNRITDNDYKPIQGRFVHDFNAPRPRRQLSEPESEKGAEPTSASSAEASDGASRENITPPALEKSHFVEDFSDHTDDKQNASAIHRESLANPAFLARVSKHIDTENLDLPPPSRTPPSVPSDQVTPRASGRVSKETINTVYRESIDRSTVRSSLSRGTRDTSPDDSSTRERDRSSPTPDARSGDLPKHMASTASRTSRFSFQMHSESSREQEQALEEKHKKKMGSKHKQKESVADSRFDELEEEDEDLSAYDDIDMDGDDDVPYVGEDEFSHFSGAYDIPDSSPGVADYTDQPGTSPYPTSNNSQLAAFPQHPHLKPYPESSSQEVTPKAKQLASTMQPMRTNTKTSKISDDMYFDDGDIDLVSASDRGTFDESVFDMSPKKSTYSFGSLRNQLPTHAEENPTSQLDHSSSRSSDQSRKSDSRPQLRLSAIPSRIPTGESQPKSTERSSSDSDRSLQAYHKALASATNKAAQDGKFSRQTSTLAGSSVYEESLYERPQEDYEDDVFNNINSVGFDDDDDDLDDDPLIAAANAEALSVDDAGFYGQEFGFYKSGGGDAWQGGFWGNPNDNRMIGNAVMEPNLTPITERSEISNRNSFISLHQHTASWDANNNATPSPALRDLAASINLDEDDMTLGQLMKLRKDAFNGVGSSRNQFVFPGSGSSGSSPTGYPNHSPGYLPPSGLAALATERPSYETLHDSPDEGDESHADERSDDLGYDSPNSPTIRFAMTGHRATPSIASDTPNRSAGNSTLSSAISASTNNSVRDAASHSARNSASDVPIINPPRLPRPPSPSPPPTSPTSPPMPSSSVLQKLAHRPSPDAYRRASYQMPASAPAQAPNPVRSHGRSDRDSVAYVQENANWYLERRRTTSTGDVVVVGRELVEGGTI